MASELVPEEVESADTAGTPGKSLNAPRILLTDTTRSTNCARLALGFSKAGAEVSVVGPVQGHPLLKAGVLRHMLPYRGVWPLESLKAAIRAAKPDILIPCDDRAVMHLHELYAETKDSSGSGKQIAELIEYSLGQAKNFPVVLSRHLFLEAARAEGIRVPDSQPVANPSDLDSWRNEHPLPWLLKADGTSGGRGVKIASTLEQARQLTLKLSEQLSVSRVIKKWIVNRDPFWVLPWWNSSKPAILVQSFVSGYPANCAVVCWEGRVLAGIGVDVISTLGATGPAALARVVENQEMMSAAEKMVRRLGLSGFFGFDFIIEDKTSDAYLIEMNPRCTPLCHLQLGKGRDMVEALFAQLSGQALRDMPPVTEKDIIAFFPQAWHGKTDLPASSFQDVPHENPDVAEELLRPWPYRSLLTRTYQYLWLRFGEPKKLEMEDSRKSP